MCDTHETIYPGQEFFRISHAGERAGLYRVEVLPTGEEAETRLGGPLRASVITGDGGGCSGASLWRCGTRYVGRAEHGQGPFRQRD